MPVVFQLIVYGAVVTGAPRAAPSSRNWTLVIVAPADAVAEADTATVPETVAPFAGAVMLTVGGSIIVPLTSAAYADIGELGNLVPADHVVGRAERVV